MKLRKNYEYLRILFLALVAVIFISAFAFADVQTLESMGLGSNPLVPDYYLDYSTIPSFASLEYSTTSGIGIDIPSEIYLSFPSVSNTFDIYPTIVWSTNNFSLMTYSEYYYEYQNQYQQTYLQVSPSINFSSVAGGLDGVLNYYNQINPSYNNTSFSGGLNGAVKFGNTIIGADVQTQVWNGTSFSFSNPSINILSQTLFDNGNGFRVFDNFNSYTDGYYEGLGLSYFNSNGENLSGIAFTGNFQEDSWYSPSNSLEISYWNATLDSFIQRTMGNFQIRAGLPLNFSYSNPNPNWGGNGYNMNFGPSFGITYISSFGSFNFYYLYSNFSFSSNSGSFSTGISYNINF